MSATAATAPALAAFSNPNGRSRMVNPWVVAVILSVATFMEVLDTAIANVSLQHIAGGLSAGIDESTWVLTSYLVSNAVILPISGWLATTIGRKRYYMISVAIFTISSLLCGLATSLPWLVFFRVLQGLGGGGLAPSEQSILADSFPPQKHGQVFALYGIAVITAPAIGPTLGGWITDNFSWHWIFLINVPVGIASLLLTWYYVPQFLGGEQKATKKKWRWGDVDFIGFGLVSVGLGALQVVLDKGERDDWFSSHFIVIFTVVAVVCLTALVFRELNHRDPVVDLPLLKDKNFLSANVVMFAVGFILYGTTQLLPQFLQSILGYTATQAGMALTPGGFFTMAMMPMVGFLVGRSQPKYLIAIGFILEAAALTMMMGFNGQIPFQLAMWARIVQAAGLGFLFVPITAVAYVGLPQGKRNNASALMNLSRNMGGSFGISLCQTWLTRRSQFHQSRLVEHLTPYDKAYTGHIQAMTSTLMHQGVNAYQAAQSATASFYQTIQQQAAILSYLDVFRIMAIGSLLAIPLAFALRRAPRGAKLEPMH